MASQKTKKINKRASITDLIYIAMLLFAFAFFVLIGYKIMDTFNTEIVGGNIADTHGKNASVNLLAHYPGAIDNSFLFLAIGLGVGAMVLAAMVRIHPIFLVLYLILLVFIIYISGILSNIYEEAASQATLSTLANNLTNISNIMTYLPLIVGVFGSILAIIMYKSWRDQTSYG